MSPIKLIVFDLDGTLVDSRDMHYRSLNRALADVDPTFIITPQEHYSTYDGLPTTKKLELLTQNKGLSKELYSRIWNLKQHYTREYVNEYTEDERMCSVLHSLKDLGYTIYIASNSIWSIISLISARKGFVKYIDWFISNEDVQHPKPSPEMYLKCFLRAKVSPTEVLIVEDSPIGKKAALSSGAHLLSVSSPSDLTLSKVLSAINKVSTMSSDNSKKWTGKCNVVIPMAGHGSRFANAGYTFPKPLIDVNGKPMIQAVVDNLGIDTSTSRFIFIVQESHYDKYNLQDFLTRIAPGCSIVKVNGVTEGAACSVLLAKDLIDDNTPLIIANSDQLVEWMNDNPSAFYYQAQNVDGTIATFSASHPKWSYARLDKDGFVIEVAEKKVISDHATVGIYYYKHGSDFVKYAERMISKNIRVNNEFYVCPVFNEFIEDGKKVRIVDVKKMWGIGVPEDLEYYLSHHQG